MWVQEKQVLVTAELSVQFQLVDLIHHICRDYFLSEILKGICTFLGMCACIHTDGYTNMCGHASTFLFGNDEIYIF